MGYYCVYGYFRSEFDLIARCGSMLNCSSLASKAKIINFHFRRTNCVFDVLHNKGNDKWHALLVCRIHLPKSKALAEFFTAANKFALIKDVRKYLRLSIFSVDFIKHAIEFDSPKFPSNVKIPSAVISISFTYGRLTDIFTIHFLILIILSATKKFE